MYVRYFAWMFPPSTLTFVSDYIIKVPKYLIVMCKNKQIQIDILQYLKAWHWIMYIHYNEPNNTNNTELNNTMHWESYVDPPWWNKE